MTPASIFNPKAIFTTTNGHPLWSKGLHFLNNSLQLIASPYFLLPNHNTRLYDSDNNHYLRINEQSSLKGRLFHFGIFSAALALGHHQVGYGRQITYVVSGIIIAKICSNLLTLKDRTDITKIFDFVQKHSEECDPCNLESLLKHLVENGDTPQKTHAFDILQSLTEQYELGDEDKPIAKNPAKAQELKAYIQTHGGRVD